MIKAVIFDLDDTIINTSEHIQNAIEFVYTENKEYLKKITKDKFIKINKEEIIKLIKNKKIRVSQIGYLIWFNMFEVLNIKPNHILINKFFNDFQNYILNNISLKPGFKEILKFLKRNKIEVAILSNGSFDEKIKKIMAVKISKDVDILVTSELTKNDKPKNDSLIYLINKLNLKNNEVIYIGDSYREDVLVAKMTGIKVVYFNENKNKKEKSTNFDFKVKNHFQTIDILKTLII